MGRFRDKRDFWKKKVFLTKTLVLFERNGTSFFERTGLKLLSPGLWPRRTSPRHNLTPKSLGLYYNSCVKAIRGKGLTEDP